LNLHPIKRNADLSNSYKEKKVSVLAKHRQLFLYTWSLGRGLHLTGVHQSTGLEGDNDASKTRIKTEGSG